MSDPSQAETVLSKLLASSDSGIAAKPTRAANAGRIIEEIDATTTALEGSHGNAESSQPLPTIEQLQSYPNADEGPSILEQMMAAHSLAKQEKELAQKVEIDGKSLGSGFKKGFFSKSTSRGNNKYEKKPQENLANSANSSVPTPSKHQADVIDVKAKSADRLGGLVVDEVQQALKADEHPIIAQLNQKEWVTPDLVEIFQKHPIISAGMRHPKCQDAIQLMQKDPKAAQKKYGNDPEVSLFLKEFGAVMAAHFEQLAKSTDPNSDKGKDLSKHTPKISELGPLQSKALKSNQKATILADTAKEEDKKVQKILEDEELRTMLMDTQLQQILVECSDPVKFRQHMQNDVTARKIIRLQQAGLVGTAK